MVDVKGYSRRDRGKLIKVPRHHRKKRPIGKKRIVDKKPVRLYAIRDENGHILGYKSK